MVGGMISSIFLTLLVIPALYALAKQRELRRSAQTAESRIEIAPADART